MALGDATVATEGVPNEKPLIVEDFVGEERADDATDELLLISVELALLAAVNAATIDGSLLVAALDAEEDMDTASATTAPTLEEAKGYAGTVRVLGKGGTEGTDGRETLGTAGTAGTDGRTKEATVGSAGTDGTDGCDTSAGVEGTAICVSDGRDATEGTSGDDAAFAAAAAAVGTASGAETLVASVTGRAWAASVGAVESGCVTVVCATTFPAVSTVATTSTFIVLMLLPTWGALR